MKSDVSFSFSYALTIGKKRQNGYSINFRFFRNESF